MNSYQQTVKNLVAWYNTCIKDERTRHKQEIERLKQTLAADMKKTVQQYYE